MADAVDTFAPKIWFERLLLLEVFEELHGVVGLPDGVLGGVQGPHEFEGGAERFVAQSHRRVNDVFTVTAHHDESTKASISLAEKSSI